MKQTSIAIFSALLALLVGTLVLSGCQKSDLLTGPKTVYMQDVHSAARPTEIAVKHIHLDLKVDFEAKALAGSATLTLIHNDPKATDLFLDTKSLQIIDVEADGVKVRWDLGADVPHLGSPLRIVAGTKAKTVKVIYRTTEGSDALQWLSAEQTTDKKYPFLFTQGEAILTRSWIPCQDSPGVRVSFSANISVPRELMAVMSAHGNPTAINPDGIYKFDMPHPVAPYLIALSVGNLAFKPYDDLTGVYAEPSVLPTAVNEFVSMRSMVDAAEKLYGPYFWGRYDVLVLPASFPFGGMENPCLTFATPTILAGDRSLVSLVAHELAHSWSGNTVTNATWADFWLNEGFTVYFERRIMEAIEGKPYADMLSVLGYQDVVETVRDLGETSPDTRLRLDLKGRNPDDGMTDIAYEKGYFLLCYLESKVGRDAWDAFLRNYFKQNKLRSITTDVFLKTLEEDLLKPNGHSLESLKVLDWVDTPGLPQTLIVPKAARFDAVDAYVSSHQAGTPWSVEPTKQWSTHEWLRFLRAQPDGLGVPAMQSLDQAFGFSGSHNAEILAVWFRLAALNGYEPALEPMTAFLVKTGRRKFLTPTYKALIAGPWGIEKARSIYEQARPNYHFVATNTMDALLK